jgi:hypothetical protein
MIKPQPVEAAPVEELEENRKKILNMVNQLDDQELAKVSELLAKEQATEVPQEETQAETLDVDELRPPSQMTGLTHKSMISDLQKQL